MIDPEKILQIYTDGSCGENGNGGWAIWCPNTNWLQSGTDTKTTNNRMELLGMCSALDYLLNGIHKLAIIRCDSRYVVNGCNKWLENWKAKEFDGVKNQDLWMMIDHRLKALKESTKECEIVWVKGHAKDKHNERVDREAVNARKRQQVKINK